MVRVVLAAACCVFVVLSPSPSRAAAAETWSEVSSPHFTVLSNASDGRTQALVWQLEQIRSATRTLWPWLRTELSRPMLVMVAKDENSMRTLVPQYWEQRGGVRPAAVWVTSPDQYYLVVRADVQDDDRVLVNPYTSAYFIYLHLVVQSSFDQALPVWFSRGLALLLSNSLVRPKEVLVGLPLPDQLQTLRDGPRLKLAELLATARTSPGDDRHEESYRFDSQAWAFVHYLYSAENGAHRQRLERFAGMLKAGEEPKAAFREAIGHPEQYEADFAAYLTRGVYGYTRATIDAGVQRERFAKRSLSAAEGLAARAGLHVALGRNKEARTLIDQARTMHSDLPGTHVAEGLLSERAGDRDGAKAAYDRAVALETTSAYAHYRSAMLTWQGRVGDETLRQIEQSLTRAVQLNPRFASAYAALGEARSALKEPPDATLPLVRRAISLEPSNPWHRLAAARVHWRSGNLDEAAAEVRTALRVADTDEARDRARDLASQIEKARTAR